MIDFTCCFINNLSKSKNGNMSEYAKNIITDEFEEAVSDGYKLFLLAARNKFDIEVIKLLTEVKENLKNAGITIQVTMEKEVLADGESENYTGKDKKYIKDSVFGCDVGSITSYGEDSNYYSKYHNVNHFLLSNSTRVILLVDEISDNHDRSQNTENRKVDDFFVSAMLGKDVKKLMTVKEY